MSLTAKIPVTNYTNLNSGENINSSLTVDTDLDEDIKTCRICLETEIENDEELTSPCKCKGGSKYVHRTCLNTWRASSTNPDAFYKCMECRHNYKFENRTLTFFAPDLLT